MERLERVVLCLVGAVIFTLGLFVDRQAVALALVVQGPAIFVLGIVLSRVQWFRLGLKGIDVRLDRIEKRLDALVPVQPVVVKTSIPTPTIVVEDPPPTS